MSTNQFVSIDYKMRRLSAIPAGVSGMFEKPGWIKLIRFGVHKMRDTRYYASRFVNFHFTRLLNNGSSLGDLTRRGLRSTFFCICDGSKSQLTPFILESKKQWLELSPYKPSIRGLNTISTKTFETFYVSFKNYHTYDLFKHYKAYLKIKHDISRKAAEAVAVHIFLYLNIDIIPSINIENNIINSKKLKETFEAEKNNISKWFDLPIMNLEARIRFHYQILQWVEKLDAKVFSISPLCGANMPYIELCTKALEDLQKFSISRNCTFNLSEDELLGVAERINNLHDVLKTKKITSKLKQGRSVLTMMTNGITMYLLWGKEILCSRMITQTENQKRLKKQKEYEENKVVKMNEQVKKKGVIDKRTSRKRAPKIITPSKYHKVKKDTLLDSDCRGCGMYSKIALKRVKGKSFDLEQEVISIDPGHKNIVTCSRTTLKESNPKATFSLSLGDYYHKIGNIEYNEKNAIMKKKSGIEKIEADLSKASIKTANFERLKENMKIHVERASAILNYYGSNNHSRRKFKIIQKRQRFYNKIASEIAPNPSSIVALGDAKFAATHSGLSSCPVSKVVSALARERRVVIVPETNTTRMCSYCRCRKGHTKRGLSDRIKISKSGKEYRVPIHGLRHCTKCTQCLNRDENASRGIFFSFRHHYKHGCLPRFLKRKRVVYSGESVPNTKSSIKKRCTVHAKKTLQSNS